MSETVGALGEELLPSEEQMSAMLKEYAKVLRQGGAKVRAAGESVSCENAHSTALDCRKSQQSAAGAREDSGAGEVAKDSVAFTARESEAGHSYFSGVILVLYFAFALGYNFGYGNATSDTNGDMGRVQPRQGRDGNLDYFFPRKQ